MRNLASIFTTFIHITVLFTMTVVASKFTPEVLLSAPRRSAATPNSNGKLALFTVSTYSFEKHEKTSEIRILDIKSGQSNVLSKDSKASEPNWLGDEDLVVWLQGGEKGSTHLILGDASSLEKPAKTIGFFNGSVSSLKLTRLDDTTIAFAVVAQATPSGSLYNSETEEKSLTTGLVYDSLFVRHWDSYVTKNTASIWYGTIVKSGKNYSVGPSGLTNALLGGKDSGKPRLESPVPPFGGLSDFDISKSGIVFVAKDPKLNPATYTKTDLYYLPIKTFTEEEAPLPVKFKTGNLRGYSSSPVFSPDAKSVAFTRMKSDQYESDKPRLLLIPDITDLSNVQEFYETEDGNGGWDLRPDSILWSQNGEELYVTAEDGGRSKLFKLPASPRHATSLPEAVADSGSVGAVSHLAKGVDKLFISGSSLIDNSFYFITDPSSPTELQNVSSSSKGGRAFGLSQDQVSDFWFRGDGDYDVHAWVLTPSNFDKNKKYPLAYLIHGGPQGSWLDSWSTRWNPAIFAEQGYIVVTPNPTGSTGYGMALQNGIRDNWGGRPYNDLVKGFEYIEEHIPYADTSRAVALGASYGGYMVNWIQGHPLGRKFKALVTHDGVYSTLNQMASEELFFPFHDFAGTLVDNRENYEKWDPARFIKEWDTPHLIIHNELDYRLPISEGLAPFNVLQSRGIPSRFLTFPDENHWVLKPENSLLWHKTVLDWINKYSGIDKDEEDLVDKSEKLEL